MNADHHERALAVFDAFLRYVREAGTNTGARASRVPPPPSSSRADEATNPAIRVPPPNPSLKPEALPGGVRLPEARAPGGGESDWDLPTAPDQLVGPAGRPLPREIANESSIIIDEELTKPVTLPEPDASLDDGADPTATFIGEMRVLIKYGHADQVPREIDRWLRSNPDDLGAHYRIADFEITRVDASGGLERLFSLASRALDRGDVVLTHRILERVAAEAPHDLRVLALRDRLGRT